MSLCAHRNALGVPGEGFHSVRLGNVAVLDVLGTFALAWLVKRITGLHYGVSLLLTFLAGIALHRAFCVRTTVDRLLFPNVVESK